jgi:hypothetical protein
MIQSRQSQKNLKKRKVTKSSEDERRSSSSKKSVGTFSRPQSSQQHYNLRNKKDHSSADKNDLVNNPENFTPGTLVRGSIIPIMPTSGEKHFGEPKHLQSFD